MGKKKCIKESRKELLKAPELYEKKIEGKDEPSEEILTILKDPELFNKITENELDKKIVGEVETRKVIFLCSQGRLVENCQIASYNLLVNDEAGAGKDYVVSATLEILPKEVYIHKTRISPTVFTYWHNAKFEPTWTWNGKIFYPEDISENVLNCDAVKVMCSKGSSATITINQMAVEIEIIGKPVFITTTASATPSPELTRRFVILNLDSSEEQTKLIMKRHSEYKKKGIVPEYDSKYTEAMKYLKRKKVKVPYADKIDEHFPTKNMVMRTHYPRFLDFISASASFHQYQRDIDKDGFLIADGQDYDIARECFLKLCSNKYMISLTINQKKILAVFENEPELKNSVSKLHGSKISFMSLPALMTNLDILVRYGILKTELVTPDDYNRELEFYSLSDSYNPNEDITIPTYEELCRNTLPTLTALPTLPTLTALTDEKKNQIIEENGKKQQPVKAVKPVKAIKGGVELNKKICEMCHDKPAVVKKVVRDGIVGKLMEAWFCKDCLDGGKNG